MTAKRFRARYKGGIWSVWRIYPRSNNARLVASGFKLSEVLETGKMRRGSPLPLAPHYPLEKLGWLK